MTINPHIIDALAKERVAEMNRAARGERIAGDLQRDVLPTPPSQPDPATSARQHLAPAGAED